MVLIYFDQVVLLLLMVCPLKKCMSLLKPISDGKSFRTKYNQNGGATEHLLLLRLVNFLLHVKATT